MGNEFGVNVKQKTVYVVSYVKDAEYEFEIAVSQSEYEEEQKLLEFYLCKKDYECRSFIIGLFEDKANLSDSDKTIDVILDWLSSLFDSGHIDDNTFVDLENKIKLIEENFDDEDNQHGEVSKLS